MTGKPLAERVREIQWRGVAPLQYGEPFALRAFSRNQLRPLEPSGRGSGHVAKLAENGRQAAPVLSSPLSQAADALEGPGDG